MTSLTPTTLLYCFAYAGSSAQIFRGWQPQLPPNVLVRPVELPGRGRRAADPLVPDYTQLVVKLAGEVAADIAAHQQRLKTPVRYACYGHSAGAAFGFGVCSRVTELLRQPPAHCFLGAGPAPHVPKKARSMMSDAALAAELRSLSGTPSGIVDNPDVLSYFLPILRADFAAHEGAGHDSHRRLDCPLTLFAARDDELPAEAVWAWLGYTAHPVRQVVLHGGHFSVLQSPAELLGCIREDLAPLANGQGVQ